MIFHYICVSQDGTKLEGNIDSLNFDTAVADLQKRGLTVVRLDEKKGDVEVGSLHFAFKKKVEQKDIVIFSRQIATLFEAGVSALKAFRLLAVENDNPTLKEQLTIVSDDIERGTSLSNALEKQPNLFTSFYVNMVRSGEESGKLNQTFLYLADYLDREYELRQKTKKALTYPIFVIATFIVIMIVMFVFIIPKMSAMFAEQGAELPLVTRIVLGISDFFLNYGLYLQENQQLF
jgi:type II secretory pathway component PulF